jgi:hypothetical protein
MKIRNLPKKNDGGLGLTVLFLGDIRTGKIMAAEVLTNELKIRFV